MYFLTYVITMLNNRNIIIHTAFNLIYLILFNKNSINCGRATLALKYSCIKDHLLS